MTFDLKSSIGTREKVKSSVKLVNTPQRIFLTTTITLQRQWLKTSYCLPLITLLTFLFSSVHHRDVYADETSSPSQFTVTYSGARKQYGDRGSYQRDVLILALEKTKPEYGPYSTRSTTTENTRKRGIQLLQDNTYPNFLRPLVYEKKLKGNPNLRYIPFPVYLGVFSYRVCFVSPFMYKQVEQVSTLKELRKFTHVQGTDWIDADILRHNGFRVFENLSFSSIFKTIEINRFDLFCRGINEIKDEINTFSHTYEFKTNSNFALYYPIPTFYYTNSKNTLALKRVTKGLHIAFQDGSLRALWERYFRESVDFANLKQRKLFTLNNPYLPEDFIDDMARYDVVRRELNKE